MSQPPPLHDARLQDDNELTGVIIAPAAPMRPAQIQVSVDGRKVATIMAGDFINRRELPTRFPGADLTFLEAVEQPQLPGVFQVRLPDIFRAGQPHEVTAHAIIQGEPHKIFSTRSTLSERSTPTPGASSRTIITSISKMSARPGKTGSS